MVTWARMTAAESKKRVADKADGIADGVAVDCVHDWSQYLMQDFCLCKLVIVPFVDMGKYKGQISGEKAKEFCLRAPVFRCQTSRTCLLCEFVWSSGKRPETEIHTKKSTAYKWI